MFCSEALVCEPPRRASSETPARAGSDSSCGDSNPSRRPGDQAAEAAAVSLKAEAAIAAAREEAAAAVVAQQRAECVAADEGRVACAAEEMLRATRAQLGELEAACSLGQCLLASKGQQLEALRQLLEQKMSQGRASHSGMQGCAAARHLPKAIRAIYPLDASGFS